MKTNPTPINRTDLAATWPPTAAVAKSAGHKQMSPMAAIRLKCLDCSSGQPSEVRACEAVNCPLWAFRAGIHPYTAAKMKNGSVEQDFKESEAA
ncbi:hypothetical protein ABIE78_006371 [Sinorhizobium fredii]|uniref:hypothetical protein n=1 Tax=Rhizobium fredii TaxID=380 RepID=UPI00059E66BD|nr:hypothetical protein [Sinorhizobium fredii]